MAGSSVDATGMVVAKGSMQRRATIRIVSTLGDVVREWTVARAVGRATDEVEH
jgi:hypothetical protein